MKSLSRAYALLVYGFLYFPIAVLIAFSFNDSKYSVAWKGFTLDWYVELAGNDQLMAAAGRSLVIGALSATVATVIGAVGAIALYRYRFRGKGATQVSMYLLLMSPDIVFAISLLMLFLLVGLKLGLVTLLLAHITFCLPFATITILSRLQGLDPHLVEAARDLGASESAAMRHIVVPVAMPAIVAAWLLGFTYSLDDTIVSFFTTGPGFEVLPLRIYSMVRLGIKPEVNALATVMFTLSLVVVLVAQVLLRGKPHAS